MSLDKLNEGSLNFRRPKSPQAGRTLDGIVNRSPGRIDFRRATTYQPSRPQQIGNFKQAEGFHSADQPRITANPASAIALAPPIKAVPATKKLWSNRRRRRPLAAGGGRRKGVKTWRTKTWRGLSVFFVSLIIVGGFLLAKGYLKTRQVFRGGSAGAVSLEENVDPSRLRGEGDGRVNVLILGKGGEGHTAPDLTDTILIASLDPINKEAAILSIPRDLYVKVPDNGSMKINSVYARAKQVVLASGKQTAALNAKAEQAGIESIEKTVQDILGIPVHYHVLVDFTGFKKAVDAVGGIDLKAPASLRERMYIDGKQYILNVSPGQQHFDGFKALAYARSRLTSPRGDFDRAERQRLIMLALKDKILSAGTYTNPIKISQLLDAFGNHVSTNISVDEMRRLAEVSKLVPSDKITSLGLADPPNNYVTTGRVGGQSVVVPRAGIGNFKEIQYFVRNALRDGYLKKENASVMVLNGTTAAGLAAQKAYELKSFGYSVTSVGDAPSKTYKNIIVVDLRGDAKKYTRHYLQLRFKVTAVTQLPEGINPGTADFVIIVGQ